MLYSIRIHNVALIDNTLITLTDGFNVITGETGAGKSILVDSLGLLLGDRADKELIRHGTDSAEVEGIFYPSQTAIAKLEQFGIACDDGTVIIERTVTMDGRGSIRVNGKAVTLSQLREITVPLVDICGQHEHQALLSKENHLSILDNYGHNSIASLKQAVAYDYNIYNEIDKQLRNGFGTAQERDRKIDILRYQIAEIEDAALYDGIEEELSATKKRLQNAERIAQELNSAHRILADDCTVSGLGTALKSLEKLADMDETYTELAERLRSVYYEADDITSELSARIDDDTDSEAELESIDERLQYIHTLERKYGTTVAEVLKFAEDAKTQLKNLENAAELIEKLTAEREVARKKLYNKCTELSNARRKQAQTMQKAICTELAELGMKNAVFSVCFNDIPDKETESFTENGFDSVEYMFSANLGEPLKPLIKVISGGEMSRFMLAVKSIMADCDGIDTMVFDEIDTGISGKTAGVTAVKIAQIAKKHQVLCVTHLPQIAAAADTHFYIEKFEKDGKTYTAVNLLTDNRVSEIARLAGGGNSDAAYTNARELIDTYKK